VRLSGDGILTKKPPHCKSYEFLIPIKLTKNWFRCGPNAFVKISAIWNSLAMWLTSTFPSWMKCRTWWYLMSIFFDLAWFVVVPSDRSKVVSLFDRRTMGMDGMLNSSKNWAHATASRDASERAMYSDFIVKLAMVVCLWDDQDTSPPCTTNA
jgi:hypothetical protein